MDTKDSPFPPDAPAAFWTELEQAKVRERNRGPREMQDTQASVGVEEPREPWLLSRHWSAGDPEIQAVQARHDSIIRSAAPDHPWQRFLEARRDVIEWMLSDGHDAAQIARVLSMDPGQVRLIHLSTVEREADRTIRGGARTVTRKAEEAHCG
jgi:hypothetical protein